MASWNKQPNFFASLQSESEFAKIVINFLFHFEIKANFETILPFKILSRLLLNLYVFEALFLRKFYFESFETILSGSRLQRRITIPAKCAKDVRR